MLTCVTDGVNKLTASPQTAGKQKKGACAQLHVGRGTWRLSREAKRGRCSPAATAAEAAERRLLPAEAPRTSAAAPPAGPAAAADSSSAAQTQMRSPGHCSSGGRRESVLRRACRGTDAGGRYTRRQSHSGASSGGSLWTCWRYLLRTGPAHPSCCPLNSEPRRLSAPGLRVPDDSEENVAFSNNKSCFTEVGVFERGTHRTKGKVPVQVWAVLQPVKVKLTVQLTWEVKAELMLDASHIWIQRRGVTAPTVLGVEGVRSLPQGAAAGGTPEALPVEVEPLSTKPFHHVNSPAARVTLVARRGERPPHRGALKRHGRGGGCWKAKTARQSQLIFSQPQNISEVCLGSWLWQTVRKPKGTDTPRPRDC